MPPPDVDPRWYEGYFDRDFVRLYSPFLTPARTRREVAAIQQMIPLQADAHILDLACGWGRHATRLARAGYCVAGVDLSAALLRSARRRAERAGVDVEWVQADMRDLPWRERFDAVLSLFSSVGYFLSDEEDLRVLRAVRHALKPGGALLLDTMHRDQVAREFTERDWWDTGDGTTVWVEREFDARAGIVSERWHWSGQGKSGYKQHHLRVRTAPEWEVLLARAGLDVEEAFGDWDLSPFSHRSEQMIVIVRRPE